MNWDGLWIGTHRDVYEPSDDTWMLAEAVKQHVSAGMRFVEVGCGTGVASLVAARAGAKVIATDRNAQAVEQARHNAKQNRLAIDVRDTDLLEGVDGPIDLLAFNPPYLPTADDDHVEGPLDWAFDGGPDGNREALRFAEQVAQRPERPAVVLVIHSSLSDPGPLDVAMASIGYHQSIVARRGFGLETLTVRRYD